MKPKTVNARIAGIQLDVPLYTDEERTRQIIQIVADKLQEIESASTRIDTQVFALLAAIAFAAQLDDQLQHAERDQRELVKALHGVLESIRKLINQLDSPRKQDEP